MFTIKVWDKSIGAYVGFLPYDFASEQQAILAATTYIEAGCDIRIIRQS